MLNVASIARLMIVLVAAAALAACAQTRGGTIPYGVENFGRADVLRPAVLPQDYRITALDTLTVTVFQVPDLTHEYQVDLSGQLAFPLIGNVPAAGRTVAELQRDIASRLAARYLRNPDVSVSVKTSNGLLVTVDGAVRQPGAFPVTGRMSLLEVIALAHGTDENSNPRRVAIFRQIGGQRMAAAFDLTSIRRGENPNPEVYAGDIVVVDGSGVRATWRDILTALPVLALFRPIV